MTLQNLAAVGDGVKPSICIQHHPSRAALLPPLLAMLPDVEVVTDPEPDAHPCPLRCYLECLARTPEDATHRVVIQDDAILCDSFMPRMMAVLAERPDALVPLFVPGSSPHLGQVNAARAKGEDWAWLIPAWVPTVALAWPADLAARFWEVEMGKRGTLAGQRRCGDDGPVGSWVQRTKPRVNVWAPLPSLVDHPDVVESLIGRKAAAGKNPARVAAFFTGA